MRKQIKTLPNENTCRHTCRHTTKYTIPTEPKLEPTNCHVTNSRHFTHSTRERSFFFMGCGACCLYTRAPRVVKCTVSCSGIFRIFNPIFLTHPILQSENETIKNTKNTYHFRKRAAPLGYSKSNVWCNIHISVSLRNTQPVENDP